MQGDTCPANFKCGETILGFCTFPTLCDCARIVFFFFSEMTHPFSKKTCFGRFMSKTSKFDTPLMASSADLVSGFVVVSGLVREWKTTTTTTSRSNNRSNHIPNNISNIIPNNNMVGGPAIVGRPGGQQKMAPGWRRRRHLLLAPWPAHHGRTLGVVVVVVFHF